LPADPAPRLRLEEIRLLERPVQFRLPFRFGVVTLTEAPQAFVRVRVRLESGQEAWGCAAEVMAPKWFDKDAALSNAQNIDQLRCSLHDAAEHYRTPLSHTAFGHFESAYPEVVAGAGTDGHNPLLASFGQALLDRAILDAVCRSLNLSFASMLSENIAGIRADVVAPDLARFDIPAFLGALQPNDRIEARHTVGMVDPLTGADLIDGDYPHDGLPVSLEQVVDHYGHTYFKIKVRGDLDADIERLERIAAVLDHTCSSYFVTLDGNEQYEDDEGIVALLNAMGERPRLQRFTRSILFVEQPLHRKAALNRSVAALAKRFPVIIDESDGDLDAFPHARTLGYTGVSSKQCKGVYKSIFNAARCQAWNTDEPDTRYFLSAEDLTCQAGIAVQQDLALVAALGITHVERNGHHYVRGIYGAPRHEQQAFASGHAGLYTDIEGATCLRIEAGRIDLTSLACPGFAVNAEPDWRTMQEIDRPLTTTS
jgi:L-alanine-DL-glutamate epimerase-like enolase superfamily enzyme